MNRRPEQAERSSGLAARLFSIESLLAAMLCLLALATVAASLAHHHYLCDLMANLRMQGLIALIVVGGIALARRQKGTTGGILTLILVNAFSLGTETPGATPVQGAESIRVTFFNVLASNQNHDAIMEDLKKSQADVMVVLELTTTLSKRLARTFGKSHPYQLMRPDDSGNFGIGMLSSGPMDRREVFLSDAGIDSLDVDIDGFRILATHPLPPMQARLFELRNRQLQQVADRIVGTKANTTPTKTILVGDLNLTPWSPVFDELERSSHLRRAQVGFGITPTWYAFPTWAGGLVIDHALISHDLQCVDSEVGPDAGSDHRSVTVLIRSRQ